MLKALNRQGDLWLTRVYQATWCPGRAPKDWQTGLIIPIHKKGTRENALTTGAYPSLASLEKCMPSALEKDAAK